MQLRTRELPIGHQMGTVGGRGGVNPLGPGNNGALEARVMPDLHG